MAVEIARPSLLVVEGPDDEYFFTALARHLRLDAIQILPMGGKDQLRPYLKGLVGASGFASKVRCLGIARDANGDPGAAFQSVRGALEAVNLPIPERVLVPSGSSPRVNVMILPDGVSPGELEDLCLQAVVADPAMRCVEQFIGCLQAKGHPLPRDTSKARVQAFLASRREPGKLLGQAAQAGYWPWDQAAFQSVKDFLRQVASA